ncbi:aromatic ring-hydroxylating dioxygenase subunit alpha [Sphingobium sp. EM0848]|uniref:aromatic ring-hydroxylating oxygenase subunit alpha n=1 Tax=Sphingobium sp. EM0848 TaxID=2743473 RepID=UPI00159C04BA|nr:aromatic ring-hydroxylating dioxygenase subunit alpha [Sphingobium sp. EM0848]
MATVVPEESTASTEVKAHEVRPPRKPSASQIAAARSLPNNNEAVWPAFTTKLPSSLYIDEDRFDEEHRKLFMTLPLPLAPSALLAEPGSFVCRDGFGQSVILTRDKDGKVHALVNSCRHRGSRVTENDEPAKGRLMICPYHAWSYDLSGKLMAVPRREVFGELDKSELGMVKLPCVEKGGIIWVKMDHEANDDFSHVSDELVADFDALGVADMHMFALRKHEVEGNWKLILDTFLEGYHVIRLHVQTVGPLYEDTVVQVDRLGSHLRQTSARVGFTKDILAQNEESVDDLRRVVTYVYTLLPNVAFICSQDYCNMLVMQPKGVGKTIVHNFMLTNVNPQSEKLRQKWEKSLELTDGLAFPEDFSASAATYQGLTTGVVKELMIGGMEVAMEHYHEMIEEMVARA